MEELVRLRHEIHADPEVSLNEYNTRKRIVNYLRDKSPSRLIESIGKNGVAAVYEGKQPGPTVLIRADTDALPIAETNTFEHRSRNPGVAHKCGHDGHTVMLAGLGHVLQHYPPHKGRVVLLFQPAEEIGAGAHDVLHDPLFAEIAPDHVFALHNLPGLPLHEVACKNGSFTASATTLIIRMHGRTAHAAEPEMGVNPATAISDLVLASRDLEQPDTGNETFALITTVHLILGEKAYGTSPGYGEVHFTLRAWTSQRMNEIKAEIIALADRIAEARNVQNEYEWVESFDANQNDPEMARIVQAAAETNAFSYRTLSTPFKWGEDFGLFTQRYRGAMFGIGSGESSPALHNPDYDFPDAIIPTGIRMFHSITQAFTD